MNNDLALTVEDTPVLEKKPVVRPAPRDIDFDAMAKWLEEERMEATEAKARRTFTSEALLRSYNL